MSSLIWYKSDDGLHGEGLELSTNELGKPLVFLYDEIIPLCKKFNCKFFIQGQRLEFSPYWIFIEFLGERSQDKILTVMIEFNHLYGAEYHGGEIMMIEPSREFLEELELM